MPRRALVPAFLLVLAAASLGAAHPTRAAHLKWPPWLSIESPVNPFDAGARDAVFLVHAAVREGTTSVADLAGSAEGLVDGQRQSVALRFEPTARPDVYAVRRQWPATGTWVVRVTLLRTTTAIVTLDRTGAVAAVHVPTRMNGGMPLPRAVAAQEIDSALAVAVARR